MFITLSAICRFSKYELNRLNDESTTIASKSSNITTDGESASSPLGSPSSLPNSEHPLAKSKQDVTDNGEPAPSASVFVPLVSDLNEFPSLSAAPSQSSAKLVANASTRVSSAPKHAAPESISTSTSASTVPAPSEQEAPVAPASPREKPPAQVEATESPAPEPPARLPEIEAAADAKAPGTEEASPTTSLPSKSSGGRYVPPALRRAAAAAAASAGGAGTSTGSSSDLASGSGTGKSKAADEEENRPSGGKASYKPPHLRNKEQRAEASTGAGASGAAMESAPKEPMSPQKERTAADIMREKFGDKGKENRRDRDVDAEPSRLPDIGNQEDFPTLYALLYPSPREYTVSIVILVFT